MGPRREAFADTLRSVVESLPGVAWARLNAPIGRVVVSGDVAALDPERLVRVVEGVEQLFAIDARPFWRTRRDNPADREPLVRFAVELGADATAFALGLVGRALGAETRAGQIDFAAILSLLDGVPQLRSSLERMLGPATIELLLNIAQAGTQALLQGTSGPVLDVAVRVLRLRRHQAMRATWERREPQLCAEPEQHLEVEPEVGHRPVPLRHGPIEDYTNKAVLASLGGFGFGVVSSHDVSSSTAVIFGGIPKPARVGRDAFCSLLARNLARREILVMDPDALVRLDRIDDLVIDGRLLRPAGGRVQEIVILDGIDEREARRRILELLDPARPTEVRTRDDWSLRPASASSLQRRRELESRRRAQARSGGWTLTLHKRGRAVAVAFLAPIGDPEIQALVAVARKAKLRIIATSEGAGPADENGEGPPTPVAWIDPDETVAGGPALPVSIRRLQSGGRGVLFVARGASPGLLAADFGVGLPVAGEPPPWGASLIAASGLSDARLVLQAVAASRDASRQAVYLAMVEAASGLVLATAGLRARTVRRIMTATNAASLVAIGNAIRLARGIETDAYVRRAVPIPWHSLEVDDALARLRTSRAGLSSRAVAERRAHPEASSSPVRAFAGMLLDELTSPLAPVLAAGAGLSAMVGSVVDAGLIAGVVGINAIVGAAQQYRTGRVLASLSAHERTATRVRRDGAVRWVEPDALVRGDVIELEVGDVVPADARVIEADGLELDESSLTGESLPVAKGAAPSYAPAIADRTSMIWAGTSVAAGSCVAVVTAVGRDTEAQRGIAGVEPPPTGVEVRLASLTNLTAPLAALSGAALITSGVARGRPHEEVVASGVSLAVAAIPEGLPVLALLAELAAARRLSRRNALVRNPGAVEALGRVDVLCADKTGTLTEGRIRLREVSDGQAEATIDALDERHRSILAVALRASPEQTEESLPHVTDQALFDAAAPLELEPRGTAESWERVAELPFEPARGYHAVLGIRRGETMLWVKGAPEVVIPRCTSRRTRGEAIEPVDSAGREALLRHAIEMAARGLRVLAIAERVIEPRLELADRHVGDLVFRGLVGFVDPVRPSAREAIGDLRRAGVGVVMISGDHPSTAATIAGELGIPAEGVLSGPELEVLSDSELDARIEGVSVFARVTPAQKVRIVRAFQRIGKTVAMTGDGANDAPAIRLADVGISFGARATSAARQAADVVVTDDRIETIVHAVLEGRALWRGVRDAVALLVGGNVGEIAFNLAGGLLEGRAPLNARQLLLVNLLTDTFPALTIAVRPPSGGDPQALLREGPEASLGRALDRDIVWRATVTAGAASGAWLVARRLGSARRADTVGLLALVGTQLGQTLALSRGSPQVLASGLGSLGALLLAVELPGVSHFFGCRPLGPLGLAQAAVASALGTGVALVGPRLSEWLADDAAGRLARRPDVGSPPAFATPLDRLARRCGPDSILGVERGSTGRDDRGIGGPRPHVGKARRPGLWSSVATRAAISRGHLYLPAVGEISMISRMHGLARTLLHQRDQRGASDETNRSACHHSPLLGGRDRVQRTPAEGDRVPTRNRHRLFRWHRGRGVQRRRCDRGSGR